MPDRDPSPRARESAFRPLAGRAAERDAIQVLGGFRVVLNGCEIRRYKGGRTRQLFQFMLANAGRSLNKATLIDAIWGESPARHPEVSLKVAVCTLRSVIAEAHAAGGDPSAPCALRITTETCGYTLHLDDVVVDVDEFERALGLAGALYADGRHAEACRYYRKAVDVYGGPYLPDCEASWATVRRETLKDRYLQALGRLAEHAERRGDRGYAMELHLRMLDIDPCREDSYRAMMRYHALERQPARVEHWYHICVEQLRTRLGLEPERQTRDLFYRAVSGRPPAVELSGRGVTRG